MTTLSKKALSDIDNYNKLREDELDLVAHIKSMNEASKKEMLETPNCFIGMLVEDPAHWREYGVYTVKQLTRYLDEQTLYETVATATSKSYARTVVAESKYWTDEKFQKELKSYGAWADEEIENEKKFEQETYEKFESQVKKNLELGAENREQAIKWILQSLDLDKETDAGYICYSLGLSYDKEYLFKNKH